MFIFRPKIKQRIGKQSNHVGSFSSSFGQTSSPNLAGVATKLLEFSSPQVWLLSPSPQTPSPSNNLRP